MKRLLTILVLLCATSYCTAQTQQDTIIQAFAPNDTVIITPKNAVIKVKRYVSANGDGGFLRTTYVSLTLNDELCERLNYSNIYKFTLKLGSSKYVFYEFEYNKSECRIWLTDYDRGVYWSNMKYIFGNP